MDFTLTLQLDEPNFIAAIARGDRMAQKALYEEFYPRMMGVCMRYAGSNDEALDLLHEGFIKVFTNISKYKTGTSLAAWIRTIMVNNCIDFYRKAIRRRTSDIETAYNISSDEPDAVAKYSEAEILEAVHTLSPAYRAVFNMYVIEGYSHKEIGEMLDITESTSRSNLVKARTKLQEFFVAKRMIYE
jgi:RNA polymerase sigma factor (sigma-70 family)